MYPGAYSCTLLEYQVLYCTWRVSFCFFVTYSECTVWYHTLKTLNYSPCRCHLDTQRVGRVFSLIFCSVTRIHYTCSPAGVPGSSSLIDWQLLQYTSNVKMMKTATTMRMARGCYLRRHPRNVVKFNTAAGATLRPISSIVISSLTSFTTCDDTSTCGRRYFGTNTIFADRAFEGVSDEVSKQILHHARQPQTAVSLKTLLQTGRGEFLHKTYKQLDEDDNHRGATGKVLMQVSYWYFISLWLYANYKFNLTTRSFPALTNMHYTHRLLVFFAANFPSVWPIALRIWSESRTWAKCPRWWESRSCTPNPFLNWLNSTKKSQPWRTKKNSANSLNAFTIVIPRSWCKWPAGLTNFEMPFDWDNLRNWTLVVLPLIRWNRLMNSSIDSIYAASAFVSWSDSTWPCVNHPSRITLDSFVLKPVRTKSSSEPLMMPASCVHESTEMPPKLSWADDWNKHFRTFRLIYVSIHANNCLVLGVLQYHILLYILRLD